MGEQNTMDEKGFEAMLVFMIVFYFMLMIPTIVGFFFEDNILKAFSSYCPHLGGPLECVDNKEFYCHFHGYKFSKKGECISHKIKLNVVFFKVTIEEGRVYVWENL